MASPHASFVSIHGARLGLGAAGELAVRISGDVVPITSPAIDAIITVGAVNPNVRDISIQLKSVLGDLDYVATVEIIVFANADGTAFATTGGSTGIAIGTDGALLAVVAKKLFLATCEADGHIDLTWTDTGSESVAIGVRLPGGRVVRSEAFANA
jgi:hypothetical protein